MQCTVYCVTSNSLTSHHYFYSYKRRNSSSNSPALARIKTLLATGNTVLANHGRLTTFWEMSRLRAEGGRAAVRQSDETDPRAVFSNPLHSHN